MNIEIATEILPDNYRWDPKNPVTGTNRFYVRVAEELTKLTQTNVFVLYDGPQLVHNGVAYVPRSGASVVKRDLALDCNIQRPRGRGVHFQWTSFFAKFDTCIGDGYDRLFLVSDYVHSTLSHVAKCPVKVLELGTDFEVLRAPDTAARQKIACYTSSPDRGGQLLDQIWPGIAHETGYVLVKSPYSGRVTDDEMKAIYDSARFWVFPALGTDSIVAALEAQARGCIPLYVPHMALPQTCRYGVQSPDLFQLKNTCVGAFNAFDSSIESWLEGRSSALERKPIPTWTDVAKQILTEYEASK